MRNRQKTLLRDHSVPEVCLKPCPRHYSVSAVPETRAVQGPNRPRTILTKKRVAWLPFFSFFIDSNPNELKNKVEFSQDRRDNDFF